MSTQQPSLWESERTDLRRSIELTIESLLAYGGTHEHWCLAWSGGKDSTALVTVVVWLLLSGRVPAPKSLTVLYADTRMELTPLWLAARAVREELEEHAPALARLGCTLTVQTVMAPVEKRFLPYMLGRGVPPPNNGRLRWCTRQIKVDPMHAALAALREKAGAKLLMLTGVRMGESAVRDARIVLSCSRDGGECGQGWYQRDCARNAVCDTLAPLLPWRVCHVWQYLDGWAPLPEFGEFVSTRLLALAYGGRDGDEAAEINARTGCTGCPLASRDSALEVLVTMSEWSYLRPLLELRALWDWMRKPENRLRKPGGERTKAGVLAANQHRMGPLTIVARQHALAVVLDIEARANAAADAQRRPRIELLDPEELAHIARCHAEGVWPDGWSGDEPLASLPFEEAGAQLGLSLDGSGRVRLPTAQSPAEEGDGEESSMEDVADERAWFGE